MGNCGQNKKCRSRLCGRGYTVIELMVTIVIVAVLAVSVGTLFVKLLTIQENEREEAYIRERLADICGAYADDLSVGTSFCRSNGTEIVTYRHETGGVSLETGRVSHVARLASAIANGAVRFDVDAFIKQEIVRKSSHAASGDATLIPLLGDMVSFRITPFDGTGDGGGNWVSNGALGWLEATARYSVEEDGKPVVKSVKVGRVVRLWNRE